MNRFITAFDLFTTGLSQHLLHSIGSQHRPLKDPTRLPHARRQGLVAGVPQREALARRRGPAPVVAAVCRPRARLSTWVDWVNAHRPGAAGVPTTDGSGRAGAASFTKQCWRREDRHCANRAAQVQAGRRSEPPQRKCSRPPGARRNPGPATCLLLAL